LEPRTNKVHILLFYQCLMAQQNLLGEISNMTDFQAHVGSWLRMEPCDVQMVTDGVNKNLRARSTNDDVFIRFSPASLHSPSDLESEANTLKKLISLDVPCCEIVEVDGRQILGPVTVNEIEFNALVIRTIVGSPLAPVPADAKAFGRSLAQVHRASVDLPIVTKPATGEDRIHPTLRPIFRELAEQADRLRVDPEVNIGICHGDAWLGNAIMRDGTAVVFDFEFTKVGALAYDIATFIWALRAEQSKEKELIFNSFVEGYRGESDRGFRQDELKRSLLQKEINNIEFLCENVTMSREVGLATARLARETIDFVLGNEISRFSWR